MCGVGEQVRKKQQRLLKNMDAHKVMLDLLQIPYEKVSGQKPDGPKTSGQGVGDMGTPWVGHGWVLRLGKAGGAAACSIPLQSRVFVPSLPFLRVMPRCWRS